MDALVLGFVALAGAVIGAAGSSIAILVAARRQRHADHDHAVLEAAADLVAALTAIGQQLVTLRARLPNLTGLRARLAPADRVIEMLRGTTDQLAVALHAHFRLQVLSDRPALRSAADNCLEILNEIASLGFQHDTPTATEWSMVTEARLGAVRAALRDEIRAATQDQFAKVHWWS